MEPNARMARIAGLLYLVVVATGIVSLAYVPAKLIVPEDMAATLANIRADERLFRIGIAAGLICYSAFALLPVALYRIFAPAGRAVAIAMVVLAWASVPISFVNVRSRLDLLSFVNRPQAEAFGAAQLHAQAGMLLDTYRNGLLTVEVLWGLWLLPLGYLVMKSAAIPRIFGVFLVLGCLGYLLLVFGTVLIPGFGGTPLAGYVTKPAAIGEIGTCLWLLIFGAKPIAAGARPALDLQH